MRCRAPCVKLVGFTMTTIQRVSPFSIYPIALTAILVFGACATVPLKSEASTSGIRAAEEVGANDVPRAALHLQLAKEELVRAQQLSDDGEAAEAASMLMRAEVDAELAVALSRRSEQMEEAGAAMQRVKDLRAEDAASRSTPDTKESP